MNRILFALALLLALPASAQTPAWPQRDDTITVQLSAEDYVTATTGKVTLAVSAALKDSDAAQTRDEILKGAQKIAKAEWRITSFTHATDQTGLERWNATLETRLPEAQLTGLGNAAKSASRPGLQFTLNGTDLSPTLDEIEAGRAKLRETLLAKANDELARVNKNAGGRTYRIGAIEYDAVGAPLPMPAPRAHPMMAMASGNTASGEDSDAMSVDQKIQMTATVMFSTAVK